MRFSTRLFLRVTRARVLRSSRLLHFRPKGDAFSLAASRARARARLARDARLTSRRRQFRQVFIARRKDAARPLRLYSEERQMPVTYHED